jgi:mono/diheme cytochrome c family protein
MREDDVWLSRANTGPEIQDHDERITRWREVAGKALLAMSVLVIVAGVPGSHANAASNADRAAGAQIFKQNGCEHCHGSDGVGTDRGPSLATVGKRLKKEQIEQQIRDGGKQMPPFKDVLNEDETRELVDYLAHKKKAPKPAQSGS